MKRLERTVARRWRGPACVRAMVAITVLSLAGGQAPVLAASRAAAASPTAAVPTTAADPDVTIPDTRPAIGPDGKPAKPSCSAAPGRVLVQFAKSATPRDRTALYARVSGKRLRAFRMVGGLEVVKTSLPLERAIALLRSQRGVSSVEPDCIVQIEQTPNDPGFVQEWGLQNTGQDGGVPGADIDAPGAWDFRTDASAVTVAVIDTGMQLDHPDLAANLWTNTGETDGNGIDDDNNGYIDDVHGWDFVNNDAIPADDNGHGTHASGTIGARGDNGIGVAGVAWSVKLMPLKAFNASGSGQTSSIIAALDYAVANGATISNNSYGTSEFSRSLYDAFVAAGAAGHLAFAAAGNNGKNVDEVPHYPAAFRLAGVVSVAATTRADTLASFSNYGTVNVQVAAPGELIYSTLPGGTYGLLSGTSMATPHVTGVAALVAAAHPTWSASQIRDRILGTTRAVAALDGKTWTGGVVDAGAALSNAPTVLPPPLPAPTQQTLNATVTLNPTPAPVTAPSPPVFPEPQVVESSAMDLGGPQIAVDATGTPHIAYTRRFDGVHLLSQAGSSWVDRQLTQAYDDFYWLDLAVSAAGVPTVVVQREWSALDEYSDPGVIVVAAEPSTPAMTRLTAACPDADTCFQDWTPGIAFDSSGAAHVAFDRTAMSSQDLVMAPHGSAPSVSGTGAYYATNASGAWVLQRLTTGAVDGPPAIAAEADGTAHILVRRTLGSSSGLYYLTNEGGTWTSLQLTDHVEDQFASIGVDNLGGLHVSFARPGFGMYYLHRAPSGTWEAPLLVYDGNVYWPNLAVDAAGHVHVVFGLGDGNNTAAGVRYATNKSGSWVVSAIAGGQAHQPAIAVDAAGHAFIAYMQATGAPLGIQYATNLSGSFVSTLAVGSSMGGEAGTTAYAVDAAGHHHVAIASHYGQLDGGLFYGTDISGSWVFTRIAGWTNAVAMAIDSNGRAHVTFALEFDPLTNTFLPSNQRQVGYATNAGGAWQLERVSPGTDFSADGLGIAVDAADGPQIVYGNQQETSLLRARRVTGAWTIDTIYNGTGVRQPSILLDPAATLHVAFVAIQAGDTHSRVVYLHGSTSSWTATDITPSDHWHFYPSLGRSSDGTIWIAEWVVDQGISVHRIPTSGSPVSTQLTHGPYDALPTLAVAADDSVNVVYTNGVFYSGAACDVPECATGPGLRHAVLVNGTWETTKLSAYWHDSSPLLAAGGDASLSLLFYRTDMGLRSLELVPGKPSATLHLQAGSDSGTSSTDNLTNAAGLSYDVTFSRSVAGLTASDFSLGGSAAGCVVNEPIGSGTSYTLSVTACGAGTVTLLLGADTVVGVDTVTGPFSPVSAAAVTIDRTAPSATLAAPASPATPASLAYTLTLSEPVLGLAASDFLASGTAGGCVVGEPQGSGLSFTVNVAGCSDGDLDLSLSSNSVADAAGNPGPVTAAAATTVSVFQLPPAAVLTCAPASGLTNATSLACQVTFTAAPGSGSSLTAADFVVGGSAMGWTAGTPVGSGTGPYSLSIGGGSGTDGTLTVTVAAGAIADATGRPSTASGTVSLVVDRRLPTSTSPVSIPRVGTPLSGTSIPLHLSWAGADIGSAGVARYELARSTNGGSTWTTVYTSLPSPSADLTANPSGTIRFRVRAIDNAGNVGAWSTGLNLAPRLTQQTSTAVKYRGRWMTSSSSSYSGSSAKYAKIAGAYATYAFTGRSIALIATTASTRGKVKVYVNGSLVTTVDLRSSATRYRILAWQKTWSTSATRTVKLVVVGTSGRPRFDLDALVVLK